MPYYRHYSFDLWLTLIKSNPGFKAERAHYFFENYNPLKKAWKKWQQSFAGLI